MSYQPAESLRARGNIVIPKSLTLQLIPERIQENYLNVYQFLDIDTALQAADNVSECKSDDEFKVLNYNFHDAKTKETLYCIIQKRNTGQDMKWEMKNELFTGMQINQKYGIQLHDLPIASRLNEKFKTFPNHQKIIKMSLMKNEERGKLFSMTQWHKVDIFQQTNNKNRVTLSLRNPEFITRLREFAMNIDYDDICLIPILMFVGLNYRIEHLWIVRIDKNLPVDIAVSFIYNQKKNTVEVIGIYIDKYRIQKQHKLVSPQHETECKCLDNFQSKIHCLSIGNPDDSLNRLNDLQKRYEYLQKECEELRGYRNDTVSYSTSTASQLSTSISISLSSSHVT